MFDNIGDKIKGYASFTAMLGMGLSIVIGLVLLRFGAISNEGSLRIYGIVIGIGGCLSSWVGSFVLYGFGQLVENSDILVSEITKKSVTIPTASRAYTDNSEENTQESPIQVYYDPASPWTCFNCNTRNPAKNQYCKSCYVSREWSEKWHVKQSTKES